MGVLDEEAAILFAKIDGAIASIMETEMTDEVKQTIRDHANEDVYSYIPKFENRRRDKGGIADPKNMKAQYEAPTMTLTVSEEAPFQHLWGGEYPDYTTLGEVIESGNKAFYMGRAGKRPFVENAEIDMNRGAAEKIMETGLKRRGL